jgi:F0F1-type ATP synthase membrane subunit b/b'
MGQRDQAIRSARELAERSAAEARAATEEFDRKTAAARAEIYQQMDEMRKLAMNERAEILTATRAEAEAEVARASARLQAEVVEARRRLASEAEVLGAEAADRILGRKAS